MAAKDFGYDENAQYTTMDLVEDLENKLEELVEEKIEIIGNIFKLAVTESNNIDEASFANIVSFMYEVMAEVSNEQIVLNKLYDYLESKIDNLNASEFEFGTKYTEYLNLLKYFDSVEDNRLEEYMAYVEKIGHLVRTKSVSPYYLEPHRKHAVLNGVQTLSLYVSVPDIKK